jgi:hypothetical protein
VDGWCALARNSQAGHRVRGGERIARLCAACVLDTGVDGGGVSVISSRGTPVVVHATNPVARALEDLQFMVGQGPAVDALATGVPVLVDDLTSPVSADNGRWTAFRAEADSLGVGALFALPIVVGSVALGSLDLYRRSPGALRPEQVSRGLETVDALGGSLLAPDGPEADDPTAYPMTVHRAAGMVMVQLGTRIEEALVRLRAAAYADSTTVTTVALDVLEGRRRFTKEET